MSELYVLSPRGSRYRLGNVVRRGGEGVLYEGWTEVGGRERKVAIKEARTAVETFDERITDWEAQKHLLHQLKHSSIVVVHDVFVAPPPHEIDEPAPSGRRLYMVMNWAEGVTLSDWLPDHPDRTYADVARILNAVAGAVAYMHSGIDTDGVPIIHRDLTPNNVLNNEADGRIRVVDFGLARGDQERGDGRRTPGYGAPEARRGVVSKATDMFSIGALAYFLLVGEHPPELENEHDRAGEEALRRGLQRCPLLVAQPKLVNHVMAAMAADPSRRAKDVGAWAGRLAVVTSSPPVDRGRLPPPAPRPRPTPPRPSYAPLVVLAVIVALVGGGVFAAQRYQHRDGGGTTESASGPTTVVTTTTVSPTTTTTRPPPVYLYDRTSKLKLSGDVDPSEADINGTTYSRSLVYTCDLFCNDGPKGTASFVMDRAFKEFRATVGPLAGLGKGHVPVFEVFVDGVRQPPVQVPYGSFQTIKVDVTGALQLDLVITDGHVDTSPAGQALAGANLAGGESTPLPASAWGDPVLVP